MTSCDVAILGAGPAGCAAAIELRRTSSAEVVMIDADNGPDAALGESIPPDTRLLLEHLGVWDRFLTDDHQQCLGSHSVWGSPRVGYNDFLFNPLGMGWHLDRRRFNAMLRREATTAGATIRVGERFTSARSAVAASPTTLRLKGVRGVSRVRAQAVIDATGSSAAFARAAGARRVVGDELVVLTAFVGLSDGAALSQLTAVEAVEAGWWYAARVPGDRAVVALTTDAALLRDQQLHHLPRWTAALWKTTHVGPLLGGPHDPQDLHVRTMASGRLDRVAGPGWVAVGDAAASLDPVCAQGLHHALQDGVRAAHVVLSDDLDPFADALAARFSEYETVRAHCYAAERRWATAPFWRRRHAACAAPISSNYERRGEWTTTAR